MRVMFWSILFGVVITYPHINFCNKKQRSNNNALCNKVDALLKEIDVVYESHDHGGGHEAHASHDHGGHDAAPATPVATPAPAPQTMSMPETKTVSPASLTKDSAQAKTQESKKEAPSNGLSDIDKAKQQIKLAEAEISKLKELVKAAEATPVASDIKKIVELNKDLIKVFEKQIQDYRARGVPYVDPKIQQAQKNISIAERELLLYEKQLKEQKKLALKVVKSQATTTEQVAKSAPEPTAQKTEKSKEETKSSDAHAHGAAPATTTPSEHSHGGAPATSATPAAASGEHAHGQPAVALAKAGGTQTSAPAEHSHGAAAPANSNAQASPLPPLYRIGTDTPVINAYTPELNSAEPAGGHAHGVPGEKTGGAPAAPDAHAHGAPSPAVGLTPGLAAVELSEAYKNAHAFHATGLTPSQFKFSPFGFVQSEVSYATRQMLALQEHQIFLVPAEEALDRLGDDVEDRSQFFTSLHVHTGALISGPEIKVLNAKPTADISFEYYGPLPLNYAPLASPAYNVPQITPTFDAKIGGEFLVHGTLYLEWEKTTLLFGQTWHPGADPIVAVADSRVTFFGQLADPLNRFFQVRATQKAGNNLEFIAALCQYIDNKAKFNLGVEVEQTNNIAWFNFHFQARAHIGKNVFALAADIYTEQPRLFENAKLVLDQDVVSIGIDDVFPPCPDGECLCPAAERGTTSSFQDSCGVIATKLAVSSFSMMGFAKIDRDPIIAKAKILVGSNLGHPFGGFAILNDCSAQDPVKDTGIRVYGPLRIATLALDVCIKSKFEPGLYVGITKDIGSSEQVWKFQDTSPSHIPCTNEDIATGNTVNCLTTQDRLSISIFRYFQDLDYTVVIAPRLKWNLPPVTFSAEIEYTKAGYGQITDYGRVTCVEPIECTRFLVEAYFNF